MGALTSDQGLIVIAIVGALVLFGMVVFVNLLLHTSLARVPIEHRKMAPGLIWLNLIPGFSLIWWFFIVVRIADSYRDYFKTKNRTDLGDCGKGVGIGMAFCYCLSIIPLVNCLAQPAFVVLLIIYLIQVNHLKSQVVP